MIYKENSVIKMVEILGKIPELQEQTLPAEVKLEPTATRISIGSDNYPRCVLFPTLVVTSDDDGSPVIRSMQVYGTVQGLHPELLNVKTKGISRDGYTVLGWGTVDYDADVYGDVTVFPVSQVSGDTLYVDGTQISPKGTSAQFATSLINKWKGKGLYPLILTGAVDELGNVLRNDFIKEKQLLVESSNIPMAVANSDPISDVQLTNVDQAIGIDNNKTGNHSFKVVQPKTNGRVQHLSADLSAILEELRKINLRIDRIEGAPSRETPITPRYSQPPPSAPPSTNLNSIMHWVENANMRQEGKIVPLLTQFSDRDQDGRMFYKLLSNSTPTRNVGPTTEENQMKKISRIIESSKSMGLDLTPEWIIANGVRGPTADQIKEFRTFGTITAEKKGREITPVEAGAVSIVTATKIAKNAIAPSVFQAKEKEIVDYVVAIMASNGGKGLDQNQIKSLVNKYKVPKPTPLPTRRDMPISTKPKLYQPTLQEFENVQPSTSQSEEEDNPFGAIEGGREY